MFGYDERYILPLEPGDIFTLSWDTKGPIRGPFTSSIYSQSFITKQSRIWLSKTVDRLEEYLPFDFKVKKDNRPALVQISVADGPIRLEGLDLPPFQSIEGLILPGETSHKLVLRDEPKKNSFKRLNVLHELGHALGLTHPGTGGFDTNYTTADSIMSYNRTDITPWFKTADLTRLQEIWGWGSGDIDPITGIPYSESAYGYATL